MPLFFILLQLFSLSGIVDDSVFLLSVYDFKTIIKRKISKKSSFRLMYLDCIHSFPKIQFGELMNEWLSDSETFPSVRP